ncbi:P-loop containing nucleoside triphosphate hydrolase protein [Cokeromyces recurvatus]|uniref:P-loop containing nucleoside triphosphate hydrolase protein n=1 Tax=Cokeromyces recurvatus TaxID=90255 RepID=UPI00221E820F|nr:P-loop containing nucleoside triphosphate hydrolase protein [Cokeromyces recurvatus]KAI7905695.1 P-loop containing nucleoside triphosphate hydrolase protein [Cokeromyces recurvatus]
MSNYNYIIKYIIVGDSGVGKSCLLLQFTDKQFYPGRELTIGVEFGTRFIKVADGKQIKLQIWDTKAFEVLHKVIIEEQQFMIYLDEKHLNMFRRDIRNHANPHTTIVLVGNKCDLNERHRQVTREEGEKFAKENDIPLFIETSAKSAENVEKVFAEAAENIYAKIKSGVFSPNETSGIRLGHSQSALADEVIGDGRGCC